MPVINFNANPMTPFGEPFRIGDTTPTLGFLAITAISSTIQGEQNGIWEHGKLAHEIGAALKNDGKLEIDSAAQQLILKRIEKLFGNAALTFSCTALVDPSKK